MNRKSTQKLRKTTVQNINISIVFGNEDDYISLTDIARYKNSENPRFLVQGWMRRYASLELLGAWEMIHNINFKRTEFDTFKNQAGSNTFIMSPEKWIKGTGAIGITVKRGRYGGGVFAHSDIAFAFAAWISAEFHLYLIKEVQRLKREESEKLSQEWNTKRILSKANYRIHTIAVKTYLIPSTLTEKQKNYVYASEADVLNVALFGYTAKEWRDSNLGKNGNMRDYADVVHLTVLSNLEVLNSHLIQQGMPQAERLEALRKVAIEQLKLLSDNASIKKLAP